MEASRRATSQPTHPTSWSLPAYLPSAKTAGVSLLFGGAAITAVSIYKFEAIALTAGAVAASTTLGVGIAMLAAAALIASFALCYLCMKKSEENKAASDLKFEDFHKMYVAGSLDRLTPQRKKELGEVYKQKLTVCCLLNRNSEVLLEKETKNILAKLGLTPKDAVQSYIDFAYFECGEIKNPRGSRDLLELMFGGTCRELGIPLGEMLNEAAEKLASQPEKKQN
jgi:hypothetical protein